MVVLNDVGYFNDLKIYQEVEWFSYSIDSILLASSVEIKKNSILLDLCCGNGIIPLYISKFYSNKIYGMEIQKQVYDLAVKSINYNKKDNILLYNDNLENIRDYFEHESIDIITCNPPYFKKKDGNKYNTNEIKMIARHEIYFDLEKFCQTINYVMKNTGTLYMVYRPSRLDELIIVLEKHNLTVKEIQLCYPKIDKEANIILLKIRKTSKKEIKFLKPLIVHDNKGNYSKEILSKLGLKEGE